MLRKPFLCGISGLVVEKSELLRLRFKAVRCGAWFRALSRVDRAVVDLTLRVVDGVRSRRLAAAVLSVVRKLEETVEGGVSRLVKEVGFQLALKLSLFAQKRGNVHARDWASDASFAKFLVIMHINDSKMLTPRPIACRWSWRMVGMPMGGRACTKLKNQPASERLNKATLAYYP